MKELFLNASVKAMMAKDRAANTVKSTFRGEEDGDIVQTVIIIALFVLICVVVGRLLYSAIQGQASSTSSCIANVNNHGACSNFS